MLTRQKFYTGFYLLSFTLAIVGGIATGFKGYTHNPPLPYILEILILT